MEAREVKEGNKIERKLWATLIKSPLPEGKYEYIGEDLEEFNIEMNANIENKRNILGSNSINLTGYEKQATVEPYMAVKGSSLFAWLKSIVDDEKKLDEVKTTVVSVDLFEAESEGAYPAIEEEVIIEVTSFGGNTDGLQIPYNIHFTGKKKKGKFDPSKLTFTETLAA